jgi:hypothetical protein
MTVIDPLIVQASYLDPLVLQASLEATKWKATEDAAGAQRVELQDWRQIDEAWTSYRRRSQQWQQRLDDQVATKSGHLKPQTLSPSLSQESTQENLAEELDLVAEDTQTDIVDFGTAKQQLSTPTLPHRPRSMLSGQRRLNPAHITRETLLPVGAVQSSTPGASFRVARMQEAPESIVRLATPATSKGRALSSPAGEARRSIISVAGGPPRVRRSWWV